MRANILLLALMAYTAFAEDLPLLTMAPLEFANRASCAELSELPARSVFMLVDSFNAGKTAYASGLLKKKRDPQFDEKGHSQMGVKLFRLWATRLAVDILQKILAENSLMPVSSTKRVSQLSVALISNVWGNWGLIAPR